MTLNNAKTKKQNDMEKEEHRRKPSKTKWNKTNDKDQQIRQQRELDRGKKYEEEFKAYKQIAIKLVVAKQEQRQ